MRPIAKLLSVLAVPLLVVAGCTGGQGPSGSTSSAATFASAPATASPIAASPSAAPASKDPATSPSIDAKFAVGDGARQLALVCWGEGSPTVLLETGGANIEEWSGSGMVRQLASRTRVCTYDRAGTGTSDPPPNERRDADDVVSDLKALLVAADVNGPYVLLGRSFGGMIVTHYAATLPEDVVGVVVLDTPAPSATFTEESEPGLVWDYPGNTERLDVVGGFENRFAKDPPKFEVPVLVITPVPGEASAKDESFWLQVSPKSRQVELACSAEPTQGPCADAVVEFVNGLR
jgi:pimeloyl-ACP methyl ester carboxylesterase